MAKSVILHNFQGSSHKQAGQTFHCFVLTVIFFNRLNENMLFLLVSRIFYSFVSDTLVGDFLSTQLIYRGKVDFCHPPNNLCGHESKLFFADVAKREN